MVHGGLLVVRGGFLVVRGGLLMVRGGLLVVYLLRWLKDEDVVRFLVALR